MRKTALALMVTAAIALAGCGGSTNSNAGKDTKSDDGRKAPAKLTLSERDQVFCSKAKNLPALEDDTDSQWNVLFLMMSDYAENADLQKTAEELRSKTPAGSERRPYLDRVLETCAKNGMGAAAGEEDESSDSPGTAVSIDPATWPPKLHDQIPGIWVPDATISVPDDKWHFVLAGPKKRSPLAYYDKLQKDQSSPMKLQVRNEVAGGSGGKATAEDLEKMMKFELPVTKKFYDNVRRHDNVTSDGGLLLAHVSHESDGIWSETYKTMLYGNTLEVDLSCYKDKRFPDITAESCAAYGEKVAQGIHPN
ncbi:uncharacterized protein YceK [Nocardioides luteus]|uniref:Lipoprotein n=1 Tax=Nocardioides luteus TaxID=1844 RepID=A0ABQ5SYS2_9ACTN|nr:hypothetical protein [Nocardioides luteus]MDR7312560.1 uncharacterized protein YceK [Nocardioides luteus]GGR45890.1 hypothetical protein GCM10010197_09440 [Nocardioides luteus]GLJ68808.1 hypothetical protein GCM10017579_28440 [Nocardioides luteus]